MPRRCAMLLLTLAAICGCDTSGVIAPDKPQSKAPEPKPAEPAPPPVMVQDKVHVGVGVRGNDLGTGFVSTPVKAFFQTKERLVFEIQIPQAMNLFEAEKGRKPQSHEEFM